MLQSTGYDMHKIYNFTELRCLENVEMLSVTSCVERLRCCRGFYCFKFQTKKVTLTKNNVDVSNSWFLSTIKIQAIVMYNRHCSRLAVNVILRSSLI